MSHVRRIATLAELSCLVLSCLACACDPDEDAVDAVLEELAPAPSKADPAKDAADAAAKQAAEGKKAAADRFAVCMAGCFDGKVPSPTDRHTCRLTCGADRLSAEGNTASVDGKAALARFEACFDADCRRPGSTTNTATCRLTCAEAALAGDAAPTLAPTARSCAVSCLEHAGECEAACKGTPDDVATCQLQCTSLGERCVARCEEDPSARPATPTTVEASASETKTVAPVSVPKKTRESLPTPPP